MPHEYRSIRHGTAAASQHSGLHAAAAHTPHELMNVQRNEKDLTRKSRGCKGLHIAVGGGGVGESDGEGVEWGEGRAEGGSKG